ncbi:MAG: helix-turn-helix domain-containing protein [Clostridiales bacterium]|nr:helix-turn-helix domain-containing protein [Clostridiales bacterium]
MEELKPVIANNIIYLRKSMNWTQAELAQKLNYSDKAVSKWERAESIPDVIVLKRIADLFHVTIDYLMESEHTENEAKSQAVSKQQKHNRFIIALLSVSLVFLIATIIFVILRLGSVKSDISPWMVYVYAFPIAFIVLLVFNSLWGKRKTNFAIITALVWGTLLAVYLSFLHKNIWLIFMIGIPSQIIILLWANFSLKHK